MRRSYLLIITLLIAAVAGAKPPPKPAGERDAGACNKPNVSAECGDALRIVVLHDQALDRKVTCACRYSDDGANATCERCTLQQSAATPTPAVLQPSIRVVTRGEQTVAQKRDAAVWPEVIERFLSDGRARDLLGELEIHTEGFGIEFVLTCRDKPDDRRYRKSGITMPQVRDALVRNISDLVERECAPPRTETVWAGCPVEDERDRAGLNRNATTKIRLSTPLVPTEERAAWYMLHRHLIWDEFVYRCSRELLIDPVGIDDAETDRPKYRVGITLVCANDPTKRGEFDNGAGAMEASVLRRWLNGEMKRVCGLSPTATASQRAR